MKKTSLPASFALVLIITTIHALASESVSEPSAEKPKIAIDSSPGDSSNPQRRVTLDNASVEVVELLYPPGSESALHTHTHPCRVIYSLDAGELELVSTDGQSRHVRLQSGQTVFRVLDGPETHIVRNAGALQLKVWSLR